MSESPDISLLKETVRHLKEGIEGAGDIWRHEGLKKGVEIALSAASQNDVSKWVLEQAAGGYVEDSRLATNVGGIALSGPVGIAPGWDKTGKTALGWQLLGARHITPGGIPLYPQKGNRMPRLRTFDQVVGDHGTKISLNAYGFPSLGADKVVHNVRVQKESGELEIPVIMQATLNKEMYEEGNREFIPKILATTVKKLLTVADGINLGLSSPNTMGMRDAQAHDFLYEAIMASREIIGDSVPLGFKGDGDGGEERLEMYCRLAQEAELDYLELINTTARTDIKAKYNASALPGGLAGADPDYQDMAASAVKYVYEAIGDKTDIIGMGGVNNAERALVLIRNGASSVGINTGVRELGARAVTTIEIGISRELDNLPDSQGIEDIIGIGSARGAKSRFTK